MKVFLIGFMGSGKSYWGRELSAKLQLPFFDLDEQVVNSESQSINEIFDIKGEEYFRQKESEILQIITESHTSFIMACGGGAPCYFNNIDFMNQSGITVWFNTPVDILFRRLMNERDHRPLLKNFTEDQLRAFIIRKFSDRRIYYEQSKVFIDDEEPTLEGIIEKIFHA